LLAALNQMSAAVGNSLIDFECQQALERLASGRA
jgi:hypothetical protein